jgi:hypothetical protein
VSDGPFATSIAAQPGTQLDEAVERTLDEMLARLDSQIAQEKKAITELLSQLRTTLMEN